MSRSGFGRLGRIAGSAVAALALAAGIALSTAATAEADEDGWGDTPGTYTHYTFPAGTPDLSSVTWSTTVTADPGFTSHTFWSHQFGFDKGSGGYIGMQDNGGEDQMFLFSVWDVNQARPGSKGSWCQNFGGEGTGYSCRMNVPWKAGHTYTFDVASQGGGWFAATVEDTTAHTSFELGSILTPATGIRTAGMVDWVEYYEWSMRRSTCLQQPYSAAVFGLPEATTADGTRVTATATRPEDNGDCANVSSTIGPDGGVQVLGIGNSARDAVTDRAGNCLDVDGVDQDRLEWAEDADLATVENRAAVVETCHRRTDQGWVHGADRTLRLVNNFCLTAAPGAAGGGKKVPVTITTCAGTPGPLTTWTYGAHGSIVNDATGRCLYAPGGNGTGHRVELRDCTGKADQRWTAPRA
ncbi:ricin-type beta-trefoil lectin domain protein [Streptomyces sp. JV185]|uniref:DUF3472 domain-containing protein n=1 Tax=Streptomyces sp. JV185 TaxID=858638 RepID=UPI002E771E3D|nr:ricin-type beta-trefoil lectin domain protein [Streptomyces sp. JV185]MEE1772821.1 ricin-type beta-trefoil lectin domain protein [Streptomyces sp. JV185]